MFHVALHLMITSTFPKHIFSITAGESLHDNNTLRTRHTQLLSLFAFENLITMNELEPKDRASKPKGAGCSLKAVWRKEK